MGIAGMKYGGVTYISGTVDAYRSWRGLADGYNVRELGIREPVIFTTVSLWMSESMA